jgi:hypothetical protein
MGMTFEPCLVGLEFVKAQVVEEDMDSSWAVLLGLPGEGG